jgi:energy-coupling factor transporter ATP-binding protein EcfA2
MLAMDPAQSSSRGGIHLGDVGGNVEFSALGDIVGGDKIVTITTTIQISAEVVTTRPLNDASPYRGLDRFEDRDTALFFGRDQLIKSLLTQLSSSPILLVLGASGSGKSSLVRAGLLPALSKLVGSSLRYFVLVPDVNPFESLRSSLISGGFSQSETKTLLGSEPEALAALIQRLKRSEDQWLLFIDQFEEIFTQTEESLREKFIAALVAIIRANSTKVILAMRADFLERLSPFPEFAKLVEKNNLVTDMHPDELRLAIEQPAAQHGVVFQQGLVEEIIKDVQGQAGSLPLLQYTLNLLWEIEKKSLANRTLNTKAYRELGGVRGALQKRADEIYASFSDSSQPKKESSQQAIVRQIFLRLVDIATEGTGDAPWRPVRRRVPKGRFQCEELLDRLVEEKLLVSNREKAGATDSDDAAAPPEATIEVAHEALFSCWEQLKNWIAAAKHVIFVKNRLADDAERWKRIYARDARAAEDELWAGSKLDEALELRNDFVTIVGDLTEVESRFLDLSADQRDKLRKEQEEQRSRELKAAQKLAETERQRAEVESKARRRQRFFIIGLVALLAVAGLVAVIAVQEGNSARAAASQANVSLALNSHANGNDNQELAYLAKALRLNGRNSEAGALIGASLTQESWPVVTGAMKHDDAVNSAQFSADGQRVVTASSDKTARVWDAATGKALSEPMKHDDAVLSAQFSPDGQRVVTASADQTARVWDAATGKALSEPMKHDHVVNSAQFSPDGKRVVTASWDKTARVWDAATGKALSAPMKHDDMVCPRSSVPMGNGW